MNSNNLKSILLVILAFLAINDKIYCQELIEKNYIVIIFDTKSNDNLHPRKISYWITESENLNSNSNLTPLFLSLFYTSNSYEDCCLGKESYFYSFTTNSKFDFPNNFEKKLESIKEKLKTNSKKIQRIKKKKGKFKEHTSIYASPVKAKICNCKITDNKKYIFRSVYLPFSDFSLNNDFWKKNNFSNLKIDYSNFDSDY